jgi:hypothetical protein
VNIDFDIVSTPGEEWTYACHSAAGRGGCREDADLFGDTKPVVNDIVHDLPRTVNHASWAAMEFGGRKRRRVYELYIL